MPLHFSTVTACFNGCRIWGCSFKCSHSADVPAYDELRISCAGKHLAVPSRKTGGRLLLTIKCVPLCEMAMETTIGTRREARKRAALRITGWRAPEKLEKLLLESIYSLSMDQGDHSPVASEDDDDVPNAQPEKNEVISGLSNALCRSQVPEIEREPESRKRKVF